MASRKQRIASLESTAERAAGAIRPIAVDLRTYASSLDKRTTANRLIEEQLLRLAGRLEAVAELLVAEAASRATFGARLTAKVAIVALAATSAAVGGAVTGVAEVLSQAEAERLLDQTRIAKACVQEVLRSTAPTEDVESGDKVEAQVDRFTKDLMRLIDDLGEQDWIALTPTYRYLYHMAEASRYGKDLGQQLDDALDVLAALSEATRGEFRELAPLTLGREVAWLMARRDSLEEALPAS